MNYTKELDVAKSVAKEMGKIQLKNFRKNLKVIRKSPKDFVSNVDLECQNLSYELLRKDFQYEILSEERKTQDEIGTKLFWIIDPVDGTHNYISGLPNFGVSIALATKKEFLLGVIYLPYFDEMYYAVKNQGAFMNDEKIQVSKNNDLEKSMITFDNQFYLNKKSFDGNGNYSIGVKEQIIFPEIDFDNIDTIRGLDITITTSANSDAEALALLQAFNFPIKQ